MEITGVICAIYATQQITEKFRKRGFVLELEEEHNGDVYTNYAVMQLLNSKCDLLDHEPTDTDTLKFIVGDKVKVFFDIKGTKAKNSETYFNNLTATDIIAVPQKFEAVNPVPEKNPAQYRQPTPASAPVHPYNAPSPAPMAQPLFAGTSAVPQGYQTNYTQQAGTIDDLPF